MTGPGQPAQGDSPLSGPPALRLALAQMPVEPGEPSRNVARAEEWIARAAVEGAQMVLLPEALD